MKNYSRADLGGCYPPKPHPIIVNYLDAALFSLHDKNNTTLMTKFTQPGRSQRHTMPETCYDHFELYTFVTNCYYTCDFYYICDQLLLHL